MTFKVQHLFSSHFRDYQYEKQTKRGIQNVFVLILCCVSAIPVLVQEGRSQSIALDIRHDPKTMDLMDPRGFISACYHATCLKPGSGFLAAPVCSSFVFMLLGLYCRWWG